MSVQIIPKELAFTFFHFVPWHCPCSSITHAHFIHYWSNSVVGAYVWLRQSGFFSISKRSKRTISGVQWMVLGEYLYSVGCITWPEKFFVCHLDGVHRTFFPLLFLFWLLFRWDGLCTFEHWMASRDGQRKRCELAIIMWWTGMVDVYNKTILKYSMFKTFEFQVPKVNSLSQYVKISEWHGSSACRAFHSH